MEEDARNLMIDLLSRQEMIFCQLRAEYGDYDFEKAQRFAYSIAISMLDIEKKEYERQIAFAVKFMDENIGGEGYAHVNGMRAAYQTMINKFQQYIESIDEKIKANVEFNRKIKINFFP